MIVSLALVIALSLVASGVWFYAVTQLHVFAHQTHHAYYGLVLVIAAVPFYPSSAWAQSLAWVGFLTLLDDTVQHSVQLYGLRTQRMACYLWRSPLHVLGHRLGLY